MLQHILFNKEIYIIEEILFILIHVIDTREFIFTHIVLL